jgi:aryl-alcohol dehydrogenase-like predicted oxidoreductase
MLAHSSIRLQERDIIPMARHFGMALAVWNAIGGGHLQTKKQASLGVSLKLFGDHSASSVEVKG